MNKKLNKGHVIALATTVLASVGILVTLWTAYGGFEESYNYEEIAAREHWAGPLLYILALFIAGSLGYVLYTIFRDMRVNNDAHKDAENDKVKNI